MTKSNKQEKFHILKRRPILPAPWNLYPNMTLYLELSKGINVERGEKNVVAKFTSLHNEFNEPLKSFKISDFESISKANY